MKFEHIVRNNRKQRKISSHLEDFVDSKVLNFHLFSSSVNQQRIFPHLPEKMLATAAMMKLNTTPGPAICLATIPATKYMPVPQHDPTPSDVRSKVVKHF